MDRIYTFDMDSYVLDERLRLFQEQLNEGEEIVSTTSVGGRLLIVTRETKKKNKNLLLEETQGRK